MQSAVCTELPIIERHTTANKVSDTAICFENLDILVADRASGLKESWKELERVALVSVYQSYDWVDICLKTLETNERHQAMIIIGSRDGKPYFILPLVVEGNIVKHLRWIGGKHANLCMGLFHPDLLKNSGPENFKALFERIGSMVPGIVFAKLCCQPLEWDGQNNPILQLPYQESIHSAYFIDLKDGFEAVINNGNGKRKRKKFRSQVREAEKAGGYRMIVPSSSGEALNLLDVFRSQKSHRFAQQGIQDVFASPCSRDFLGKLATTPGDEQSSSLELFALEIGGEIRAIFGGGRFGTHLSGYFSSISDDELSHTSPGEMLLYLMLEHCAKNGYISVDLGCGDERYKRSWCQKQIALGDVLLPLSKRAIPLVFGYKLWCIVKRKVRSSAFLWNIVRKVRAKRANFFRR
ncbi:MAG: GNAT family N-acetyltransferase [Rhizobiaceae bacterium]